MFLLNDGKTFAVVNFVVSIPRMPYFLAKTFLSKTRNRHCEKTLLAFKEMSFVIYFFFLLCDETLQQTTHSFSQQQKQQKLSFFLFALPVWEKVVFVIFLNTKRQIKRKI